MPAYWFDVFTPSTWEEARANGFAVSGFSQSKRGVVARVEPGDILICYLQGRTALVGALEVTGKSYYATEPQIWKSNAFPSRLPVRLVVDLTLDGVLDFRDLLPHLSFYNPENLRSTWARLQGSPTKLANADGRILFAALTASRAAAIESVRVQPETESQAPRTPPAAAETEPPAPLLLAGPVDSLTGELMAAQRDATHAARFERAVADALAFLGFDIQVYGKSGRTDVVLESALGHDRFRVVVDAKASSNGKVPEGQINWPAIAAHRTSEAADHAVIVGEQFAGGNLLKFADDFAIALLDTGTLVEILRLHAATPFTAADLRAVFATPGVVAPVLADLRQKSEALARHWVLIAEILRLVEGFSRYAQPLAPTAGNLHAVLVTRALDRQTEAVSPPSEQEVKDALVFLASRALGILRAVEPETAGYRLAMSLDTALARLQAIVRTVVGSSKGIADTSTARRVR